MECSSDNSMTASTPTHRVPLPTPGFASSTQLGDRQLLPSTVNHCLSIQSAVDVFRNSCLLERLKHLRELRETHSSQDFEACPQRRLISSRCLSVTRYGLMKAIGYIAVNHSCPTDNANSAAVSCDISLIRAICMSPCIIAKLIITMPYFTITRHPTRDAIGINVHEFGAKSKDDPRIVFRNVVRNVS